MNNFHEKPQRVYKGGDKRFRSINDFKIRPVEISIVAPKKTKIKNKMTRCFKCKNCKEDWTWDSEDDRPVKFCPFCGSEKIERDEELENDIATM
jgi:rRNA maturation endonuclease Nob1